MVGRALRQRRGVFVVIVGPDGVGKTSVANSLISGWDGPTAYFHFRPPLRGSLDPAPVPGMAVGDKWPDEAGSKVGGWLRLVRVAVLATLGYFGTVFPALRRGALVVGDRYLYGYQVQPRALRFHGPNVLARLAARAVPQPTLVVNLTAPPPVIHERKAELSIVEIEEELRLWALVGGRRAQSFDATETPDEIAARILDRLGVGKKGGVT